ncbi:cGMP-specific 3',5'-cyclic phosphodiesterase [Notolabrus celidotus]|uniref:cGMP-specific 3',5'-cyclic phosphodiesterase n=1 Tax=Notolabrus celidotus TaxID=1203425 RepID=UPI0014905792|nr:cGMP-specific 3',5'-cyclic phosphodiesterase [Notolabrus celidotus]
MPCLQSELLEFMESDSATPARASFEAAVMTQEFPRREKETKPLMMRGMGWFFSPLWSPRSKTRKKRFEDGMKRDHVEAWLDDHSDFTRAYFLRRASVVSSQTETSPQLPRLPKSSSDHSGLLMKAPPHRRGSSQFSGPHLNISSTSDRLKPLTSNRGASEWIDCFSPDVGCHSPLSPRSSRFTFSPCLPLSPICPSSPELSHSPPQQQRPTATSTTACGNGEWCPWIMELLRGGLSWVGSVAELCHGAVLHSGELMEAEGCCLSLVKKDCGGRSTLEEAVALMELGCFSERNLCSHAHMELVKGIMGCVLATGSLMNLKDVSEDPRFEIDDDQSSKIRSILCIPIKNHRGEVVGVVVMINKISGADGSVSVFTNMDEKVLSNHMDVLGMVLDNVQLYESSRQEAKRSQALIEMAEVLSKEHQSFEVLLSKMAATIMPFTRAQYCTIFIPNDQDKDSFSRVIHLECEELGSTCQIYRREHDISDIDQTYARRTLSAMETLNMSESCEESMKSLICCPVRNEMSEDVIAVCQLMSKRCRDSDELEAFNRYDQRLLEDLAVYCGLALQYAQAVQITEERRASIEVTQEVLAYHITAAEQEVQALQEASIPSAKSLHILDFHFSGFGLPEDVTSQATVRMFLDLNLVQDFNIDYKSLCQWVLTVRRGYRNSVPYHNWSHALSTAQSMFAILTATDQLQTIFSRLEIFALMISTLCHDIDHRGVSNSYIERSQQPLAQLYGHSTLENHHYNLCLFILNNTGSQILSGLSPEDHRSVLQMIKRAILATDLTVFMERRKEFFSLTKKSKVSWKSEKQRDLLRSMLMTASDLSAITKPWQEQKRIANLVATEFFAQGDREKEEFKINPVGIMNRANSTRLPYLQVEYIDDICYPLYKAVSSQFDACSPLLIGCKKNRENWKQLAREAEEDSENSFCSVTLEAHEDDEEKLQTEE